MHKKGDRFVGRWKKIKEFKEKIRDNGIVVVKGDREIGKIKFLVSNEFNRKKFAGRMGKILQELKFHEYIDVLCYTHEEFERKLKESYVVRDAVKKGYNVI